MSLLLLFVTSLSFCCLIVYFGDLHCVCDLKPSIVEFSPCAPTKLPVCYNSFFKHFFMKICARKLILEKNILKGNIIFLKLCYFCSKKKKKKGMKKSFKTISLSFYSEDKNINLAKKCFSPPIDSPLLLISIVYIGIIMHFMA